MKNRYKVLIVVLVVLVAFRLYLPTLVKNYLNKTLAELPDYTGYVTDVDIHLYRGAYAIDSLHIMKEDDKEVVPFFDATRIDLSVEWSALFKGAIVGEIEVTEPQLNFVASNDSVTQSGAEVDWTETIKDLMPLTINRFALTDGEVHFVNYEAEPNVDLYLHHLDMVLTNLRNVEDKSVKLPSDLKVVATSIGGGQLAVDGKLNLLKKIPDMDLSIKFEGVDLPKLNDFLQHYALLDVEKGQFDLYSEMAIADGQIEGYVKPIIQDLKMINLKKDIKKPLQFLWEAVSGIVLEIFENQSKDQFATKVPLKGDLNQTKTLIGPTIWNIFKNAFISAFSKSTDGTIDFNKVSGEEEKE